MSKYLDRFKRLASSEELEIYGDILIVEKIKEEERKVGSFVLATPPGHRDTYGQDRPHLVRVLAVGKGFYDELTGEDKPVSVQPGDIVLVGSVSVRYFSTFGSMVQYEQDTIGVTRESEIQLRWKGQGAFDSYFQALNDPISDPIKDQE